MEPISSSRNPKIVEAARLQRTKDRLRSGLTLVEGPNLLREALAAGIEVLRVFALANDAQTFDLAQGCDVVVVEPNVLRRLANTETPRGPVAVVRVPGPVAPVTDVLWTESSDPGNAGTLIRSAAAFGLDIVFSPNGVDPWSPKVVRAAAGAHFHTRLSVGRPPELWTWVAAVPRGGRPPRQVFASLEANEPWALLIGDEARGLSVDVVEASVQATIPMVEGSTESLNAGVAGSILAYELRLERNTVGHPFLRH